MAKNNYTKYDEDFKKSLVSLHQNGKTQSQLCKEYGVSLGKLYRSDGINTVMDLVRANKGITLGPRSFADYFQVRAIPLEPATYISLNFICLKDRAAAPEITLLKNHLIHACSRFLE